MSEKKERTAEGAKLPRGIRNNNPLNIRRNTTYWMGMIEKGTDRAFVQFQEPYYGIRAGIIILTTYVTNYHIRTLKGIVHRWAPDGDGANNEKAYIKALMELGVTSDVVRTKEWLFGLLKCMCWVESRYILNRGTFELAWQYSSATPKSVWKE